MELNDALVQIREIRLGLLRSERFEGYRALPTAITGLLAALACGAQALWVRAPAAQPVDYVALWVGCATVGAGVAVVSIVGHCRRPGAELSRWRVRAALSRVLPSFSAGALVTAALVTTAPQVAWVLPGFWQILFALALFASASLLPAGLSLVAAAYLASGVACLSLGTGALSPLAMGIPFLVGQLWIAVLLHGDREHSRARRGMERFDGPA